MMSGAPDDDHAQQLEDKARLKELLIRELAQLHSSDQMGYDEVYNLIHDNYLHHYAHGWYHDPNTIGAFAFFRPQQFRSM